MLEKYDPGLIPGTIGAVIGIILGFILEKTMIMLRFSKLRKNLKDEVEGLEQKLCFATDGRVFDYMDDLVKEGSKMVSEQRVDVPPWYSFIRRHRESNEMAKLSSRIETAQSLMGQRVFLEQILISDQEQTSHIEETSSLLARANQKETSSPLAPANQDLLQTSSLPAQPNQALAQTDTANEMTNGGKLMPMNAEKMAVLNCVMKDENSIRRAMKVIADVEAECIAVDVKEKKMLVIGEGCDVSFIVKFLFENGLPEQLSVSAAKEETKTEGKKKRC